MITREFASGYEPYVRRDGCDGAGRGQSIVRVEHWMHDRDRPAATVVSLHGVAMGSPRLSALALLSSHWFERGLDVVLLTLPFGRLLTTRPARMSYGVLSTDVGDLNETVREAVHDVTMITTWLRAETRAPVGLFGLSLGGYVTALTAGLMTGLDFVVPVSSPVSVGDLAWRFFARSRHYGQSTCPPPTRDELQEFYRVHSPLAHRLRVPRDRVLIVAGRGDRIVPPEHPLLLWRHWDEPQLYWFSGSHLMPFGRPHLVAAIVRHLDGLGIL
jgi:pimeloyl-ACP methyl ester carboxylesterase